MLKIKVSLYC